MRFLDDDQMAKVVEELEDQVEQLQARLDAVAHLVGYWRQRYEDAKLTDAPLEEYARYMNCADDLEQALEQKE